VFDGAAGREGAGDGEEDDLFVGPFGGGVVGYRDAAGGYVVGGGVVGDVAGGEGLEGERRGGRGNREGEEGTRR
jgi:hypothetical protein